MRVILLVVGGTASERLSGVVSLFEQPRAALLYILIISYK
jgi:hypothetical protein